MVLGVAAEVMRKDVTDVCGNQKRELAGFCCGFFLVCFVVCLFVFEGHPSSGLGELCVNKPVLCKLSLTQVRTLSWEPGMLSRSWEVYSIKR